MSLGFELTLEQTQKLALTPELIQSIKILQLNSAELESFVEEQIMVNPVLEREPETKDDTRGVPSGYARERKQGVPFETNDINRITLSEHLMFQLQFIKCGKKCSAAARFIIESLDDNGYMTLNPDEIAKATDVSVQTVRDALEIVRDMDPAGVGAFDISDCLILQLKAAGTYSEDKGRIIHEFLNEVALNRLGQISRATGLQTGEIQNIVDEIRSLDPKPGRAFASSDETRYIVPDVYLEKENGEYRVLLSENSGPKISINSYYTDLMNDCMNDEQLKVYLSEKIKAATWLIKSIEQRKKTIYNIASAIVRYQQDFFEYGEKYLKPLVLRQIAEETDVHESTVSRTINGKYIYTPKGVFELKYFFTSGVAGNGGEGVSSNSVKMQIREIIEAENPSRPLSDQKISDMLNSKGVEISRRTVAKYREEMGIFSSQQRKRY